MTTAYADPWTIFDVDTKPRRHIPTPIRWVGYGAHVASDQVKRGARRAKRAVVNGYESASDFVYRHPRAQDVVGVVWFTILFTIAYLVAFMIILGLLALL